MLQELAERIARISFETSIDATKETPFSEYATAAGHPRRGGKVDDISVVVARVVSSEYGPPKGTFYSEMIEEIVDPAAGSINPENYF